MGRRYTLRRLCLGRAKRSQGCPPPPHLAEGAERAERAARRWLPALLPAATAVVMALTTPGERPDSNSSSLRRTSASPWRHVGLAPPPALTVMATVSGPTTGTLFVRVVVSNPPVVTVDSVQILQSDAGTPDHPPGVARRSGIGTGQARQCHHGDRLPHGRELLGCPAWGQPGHDQRRLPGRRRDAATREPRALGRRRRRGGRRRSSRHWLRLGDLGELRRNARGAIHRHGRQRDPRDLPGARGRNAEHQLE